MAMYKGGQTKCELYKANKIARWSAWLDASPLYPNPWQHVHHSPFALLRRNNAFHETSHLEDQRYVLRQEGFRLD